MAGGKKGLGRGLESLFDDVSVNVDVSGENQDIESAGSILFIDINDIKPNSNQPRKHFNSEKIEELANSIKEHGILQPIMVRQKEKGYEIVAGERRWRAARRAELKKVPCIVKELTEEQNLLVALIENMQREDLNPIEEAEAVQEMIEKYGLTQEQVSKSVGKSRPYITNALRLLKLPEEVKNMVVEGVLSNGHARAIAGISDKKEKISMAQQAAEEGWTVREIEQKINGSSEKAQRKKRGIPRKKTGDESAVEEELKEILGTKVCIETGHKKGKIEIEYYSREELDRLIDLLRTLK